MLDGFVALSAVGAVGTVERLGFGGAAEVFVKWAMVGL